jgi:hypothetical protein
MLWKACPGEFFYMKSALPFLAATALVIASGLCAASARADDPAYTGAAHGNIGNPPPARQISPDGAAVDGTDDVAQDAQDGGTTEDQFNQIVNDSAPPPTLQQAPGEEPAAPAQDPAKADKCAAFMTSANAYAMCQDRMIKIQRMEDANARRNQPPPETKPPVKAPPVTDDKSAGTEDKPATDENSADGKLTDKVKHFYTPNPQTNTQH